MPPNPHSTDNLPLAPHRRLGAWHGINSISKHNWVVSTNWKALYQQSAQVMIRPDISTNGWIDRKTTSDSHKHAVLDAHYQSAPLSDSHQHYFSEYVIVECFLFSFSVKLIMLFCPGMHSIPSEQRLHWTLSLLLT